jgi:hypothetical protein
MLTGPRQSNITIEAPSSLMRTGRERGKENESADRETIDVLVGSSDRPSISQDRKHTGKKKRKERRGLQYRLPCGEARKRVYCVSGCESQCCTYATRSKNGEVEGFSERGSCWRRIARRREGEREGDLNGKEVNVMFSR